MSEGTSAYLDRRYWLAIFRAVWHDIKRCNILQSAYSMAYVSLLSLIPSLAAIFAVISLFSPMMDESSGLVDQTRRFLLEHLAAGSGEQAIGYMEGFIDNLDVQKVGLTGFAGTLVTLILLLRQIELALNHIFRIKESRGLVTRFINFWTFSTLGAFSLTLFFATLSSYESTEFEQILTILGRSASKIFMIVLFTLMYKVIPNCNVHTRAAFAGGVFATLLLQLAGSLFSSYIHLFSNYQAVYGAALAALPTFLLWLYIIWLIVLLGALVTWRLHIGTRAIFTEHISGSGYEQADETLARLYLPSVIAMMTAKDFMTGHAKGLREEDFAKNIEVPIDWIRDALDLLQSRKIISIARSEDNSEQIFLRRPADKIALHETGVIGEENSKANFPPFFQEEIAKVKLGYVNPNATIAELIV